MGGPMTQSDESVSALSSEAHACQASEVRVGDTYISFLGPRIVTRILRPRLGRLRIEWRDGGADLDDGAEVYALWGTSR